MNQFYAGQYVTTKIYYLLKGYRMRTTAKVWHDALAQPDALLCVRFSDSESQIRRNQITSRVIEGPDERYQIATSAFHCILSGSLNEAAYNTCSAGVMEIRIAGSSCRRPQLLFGNFFSSHLIGPSVFYLWDDSQPVDLFSKIFYSCNQTDNPLDHSQSPNCL